MTEEIDEKAIEGDIEDEEETNTKDGWRCSICGTVNGPQALACSGECPDCDGKGVQKGNVFTHNGKQYQGLCYTCFGKGRGHGGDDSKRLNYGSNGMCNGTNPHPARMIDNVYRIQAGQIAKLESEVELLKKAVLNK